MTWNWWIGSAMTATVPSLLRRDADGQSAVMSFALSLGRHARIARGREACRPHHMDDAGRKAEQQKNNQPPRRDPEQAVERPADGGTDQDPGHEFAGESKPA